MKSYSRCVLTDERKIICSVNKRGQEGFSWQNGQLELTAMSVSEVRNILCLMI